MYRRRPGLTILEVLVIILVIGILIALLLPSVSSQEPSRRQVCHNNLKQLGLAMLNYHDAHKVFPPGITGQNFGTTDAEICQFVATSSTCDNPRFSRVTALTLILPYLEEEKTLDAYNQQLASCAAENYTSVATVVKVFVCPANPRQYTPISLPYYLTPPGVKPLAGPTDYVLSIGGVGLLTCETSFGIMTGGPRIGNPAIMRPGVGAFNINSSVSTDKIKDGTAKTFLMGESVGGAELYVGLVGGRIVEGAEPMTSASKRVCDNAWSQAWISSQNGGAAQGYGSVFGATAWNAWYDSQRNLTDHANGANWFPYPINEAGKKFNRPTWSQNSRPATNFTGTNGAALPSDVGSVQGFRSYHSSVAMFLMADASVQALNENTDVRILVAYSTVMGKEPVEHSE